MPYLFTLPGLLCGLALSIEDVRCRRVPIAWVAVGALLQLAADFAYGVVANDLFVLLQALLFTVLCCLVQFALALIVPKSLGFGDVTALVPMGLSVGLFGLLPELVWTLTPAELAKLAARVIANAPAPEVSVHQLHVPLVDLRAQSVVVRDRLRKALESGSQSMSFSELTQDCASRIEVVARFMAVLVFFKQGVLQYRQNGPFEELHLRWVAGVDDAMSDVNISEGDFA